MWKFIAVPFDFRASQCPFSFSLFTWLCATLRSSRCGSPSTESKNNFFILLKWKLFCFGSFSESPICSLAMIPLPSIFHYKLKGPPWLCAFKSAWWLQIYVIYHPETTCPLCAWLPSVCLSLWQWLRVAAIAAPVGHSLGDLVNRPNQVTKTCVAKLPFSRLNTPLTQQWLTLNCSF